MSVILLNRQARARVWVGELPNLRYSIARISERSLQATPTAQLARTAAVEVFIPYGPIAHYGLLGATFTPGHSRELLLPVAVSDAEQRPFARSLAGRFDTVRVGLPEEYGDSVLLELTEVAETTPIGSGTLRCDQAAHGVMGSAPIVFRRLARAIVALLNDRKPPFSQEQLADLLLRG